VLAIAQLSRKWLCPFLVGWVVGQAQGHFILAIVIISGENNNQKSRKTKKYSGRSGSWLSSSFLQSKQGSISHPTRMDTTHIIRLLLFLQCKVVVKVVHGQVQRHSRKSHGG